MRNPHQIQIESFYGREKRMPTYSEMMKLFGFKSKNAVYKIVKKLVEAGFVAKDHLGRLIPTESFGEIPMLGFVTAGLPATVDEELTDTINLDDNGRLHSDDGTAIRWRDGVGLYFSHGQKIPGWIIISPEKITVENIQSEKNAEIKRVMIEKYDVSRYLIDIGAEIVDMDSLTLVGSAPRALIKDKAGNQWLIGTDGSTARVYHMAVDAQIKTCKQAHEQLCGFDEDRLCVEC